MSKSIDQIRAKIKAANAEVRIYQKAYNMAERALLRSIRELNRLENRLADQLAKTK